ncbi:hypothetical protein Pmani_009076 [Petrolisthes manimaculis]|uniref:Uncharacterized protein n=1 Tax=Petrolisthes manimaculis TaxID=1843537 RepID=A0AAE1Q5G7_9EUCA|nr:hypothetical protein Pmani_009076 [Petrolisthes manimaculis]
MAAQAEVYQRSSCLLQSPDFCYISQHTLTCTPSCSSADAGGFSQQHDENPPIQELDESEICPSSGVGSQQDAESESQQDNGDSSEEFVESVESEPDTRIFEGVIESQLSEFLSQFEDLHIPALPPLNINGDDQYSVSLALSDLNIRGIDVTEFTHTSEGFQANRQDFQTFRMKFNKLYLDVGTYNAAGHLLNLPFNGEGPMSLGFINLDITIDFTWDPFKPLYSRQKK